MSRSAHAYRLLGQVRFNPEDHHARKQDETCRHQPRKCRVDREKQRDLVHPLSRAIVAAESRKVFYIQRSIVHDLSELCRQARA